MRTPAKRYPKGTWMRLRSGTLLRELMNMKSLSGADVARSADVTRAFISALLVGKKTSCTEKVARRIAERLEVPLEVLFDPRVSTGSGRVDNRKAAA